MPISQGGGGGASGGGSALTALKTIARGTAGPIHFTLIPQSSEDLIFEALLRSSANEGGTTDSAVVILNSDNTDADYNGYLTWNNGTTPTATASPSSKQICNKCVDDGGTAGYFTYLRVVIPGYASSTLSKIVGVTWHTRVAAAGTVVVGNSTLTFASTSPITDVQFAFGNATDAAAGSRVDMYGQGTAAGTP